MNHIIKTTCANDSYYDGMTNEGSRANDDIQPPELREQRETEHAVENIVGHKRAKDGIRYCTRWYGYSPTDVTHGPATNITSHLIHCYQIRQTRNTKGSISAQQKDKARQNDPRQTGKTKTKHQNHHKHNRQLQTVRRSSRLRSR